MAISIGCSVDKTRTWPCNPPRDPWTPRHLLTPIPLPLVPHPPPRLGADPTDSYSARILHPRDSLRSQRKREGGVTWLLRLPAE
jgi:hypothetical protein